MGVLGADLAGGLLADLVEDVGQDDRRSLIDEQLPLGRTLTPWPRR